MHARIAPTPAHAIYEVDNPFRAPTSKAGPVASRSAGDGRLATRSARLAAVLIDYLVVGGATLPIFGAERMLARSGGDDLLTPLTFLLVVELVAIGSLQAFLLVRDGQSLGKRWMGIRVVDHDNGTPVSGARMLAVRVLLNLALRRIPFYLVVDGMCILMPERRCLHDLMAGTKVVESTVRQ